MKVSIIIRFKNEEHYLPWVFRAISSQRTQIDYEIICVNNNSSDQSEFIAKKYADKIISIDEYSPGKALNDAIKICSGDYICCLSAHTIPANDCVSVFL